MKPIYEKITPNPGTSFYIESFKGGAICNGPFWHVHPEYELVYIHSGKGKRHIGSHISFYESGDLVMLGPNLPHSAFSNTDHPDNYEVVVQIHPELLKQGLFELQEFEQIKALFHRSAQGIQFYGSIKVEVGDMLNDLCERSAAERMLGLLHVLLKLSTSREYHLLNVKEMIMEIHSNDYERINCIYDHISQHYHQQIFLEEAASLSGLTRNAFCRFFKKVTGKTFIQFLNEYRITNARELMYSRRISISEVMVRCGFNELSYFSRQFKRITGYTPTRYRASVRAWG